MGPTGVSASGVELENIEIRIRAKGNKRRIKTSVISGSILIETLALMTAGSGFIVDCGLQVESGRMPKIW